MQQKLSFLFILFLFAAVDSQILSPVSYCFGNCLDCEPNNLTFCKGPQSCQWGYYRQSEKGACVQSPSMSIQSSKLGQRSISTPQNISESWGVKTKLTVCEYNSPNGKQYIDALGFYTQVTMLEKTYDIDQSSNIIFLSFNLLRDEWQPFSDFLLIDISNNEVTLGTLQISYQTLIKVGSSPTSIVCGGQKVISQKYNIKIINNQKNVSKITVVLTSFLYKSKWAISNIKLVSGCSNYSMFDKKSQSCTRCDPDSYLATPLVGQSWCQKCSNMCRTCQSKNKCKTCVDGAQMNNKSQCNFPKNIKTQQLVIANNTVSCGINYSFYMGSSVKSIVFPQVRNQDNNLYDQIQLQFTIYYSPADWTASSNSRISVQVNQVEVFILDYQNLTNLGLTECNLFPDNQMASIQIVTPLKIHIDNSIQLQFSLAGKNPNASFGVSNVIIRQFIRKQTANNSTINQNIQVNHSSMINQQSANIVKSNQPSLEKVQIISSSTLKSQIQTQQVLLSNSSQPQIQQAKPQPIQPLISNNNSKPSKNEQTPYIALQSANSILYIPSSIHQISGIQVVLTNISQINAITVTIDKLNTNLYQIVDQYIKNNNLYIFVRIDQSFTNGLLTVYNISTQRLLQSKQSSIATVWINRFDALSSNQLSAISSLSIAFSIFAWAAVILIIIAVLTGYGVVVQEYVISLQLIFLHVYIASDYIPLTFRDIIAGLNIIENLNYFIPQFGSQIQQIWLGNVVQSGPIRFSLYNTDINFSRQFYPIIFINIFYTLWFIGIFFLRKYMHKKDIIEEEKTPLHRAVDNIANRVINFADQIWRYQFLATIWLSFMQFYNLVYPQDSNRSQAMNTILCFFSFFCSLGWPVLINFSIRKYYYESEYADYLYNFEDIFYKKIPQYFLPSIHHRYVYPILKVSKLFFIALFIAYTGTIATIPLVFLLISNLLEICYLKYFKIYSDSEYLSYKMIENSLFILIDFVLLFLCFFSSLAQTESYIYIGFILTVFSFLIMINSVMRMVYLGKSKYIQMFNEQPLDDIAKNPKSIRTLRVV